MRAHGLEIHAPKWYSHKCAIPPKPQDGVAKFQRGLTFLFVILVEIDVCDKGFVEGVQLSNNITIRKCHSLTKGGQTKTWFRVSHCRFWGDNEHYLTSDCSTSCKSTCGLISSIVLEQRCARPQLRLLNSLPPAGAQIEFERSQTAAWLWLGSAQTGTSGTELDRRSDRLEPNSSDFVRGRFRLSRTLRATLSHNQAHSTKFILDTLF